MIWVLWLREEERETIIKRKGPLERMQHILCSSLVRTAFVCMITKTSLIFSSSSPRLTSISSLPCPSHLHTCTCTNTPLRLAISPINVLFLPALWLFSLHTLICPSLALPRWYLIAVKQETGEQTAGEPTLILSCAICCSHMTELQTRCNTMMPHHTWHTNQSQPKSKTESERRLSAGKRQHTPTKCYSLYVWNYSFIDHTSDLSFLLFGKIKRDCIWGLLTKKKWVVLSQIVHYHLVVKVTTFYHTSTRHIPQC